MCTTGKVIQVTDVYIGTSDTCSPGVGDCFYHSQDIVTSYKAQCDGRLACVDAEAYNDTIICDGTAQQQYTLIYYQCEDAETGMCNCTNWILFYSSFIVNTN